MDFNIGGLLNKRAEVYRRDGTTDDFGQPADSWEYVDMIDCSISPSISADRRIPAGLLDKPVMSFATTSDANVQIEDRVVYGGVNYRIAALEDAAGRGIWIKGLVQEETGE